LCSAFGRTNMVHDSNFLDQSGEHTQFKDYADLRDVGELD
jgi:hypothetical protein